MDRKVWIVLSVIIATALLLALLALLLRGGNPEPPRAPSLPHSERVAGQDSRPQDAAASNSDDSNLEEADDDWAIVVRVSLDDSLQSFGLKVLRVDVELDPQEDGLATFHLGGEDTRLSKTLSAVQAEEMRLSEQRAWSASASFRLVGENVEVVRHWPELTPSRDGRQVVFDLTVAIDDLLREHTMVTGRLLHPSGEPIPSHLLRLEPPLAPDGRNLDGVTDSNGRFAVALADRAGGPRIGGQRAFGDAREWRLNEGADFEFLAASPWNIVPSLAAGSLRGVADVLHPAGPPRRKADNLLDFGDVTLPVAWVEFEADVEDISVSVFSGEYYALPMLSPSMRFLLPAGVWHYSALVVAEFGYGIRYRSGTAGEITVEAGRDQRIRLSLPQERFLTVDVMTPEGPLSAAEFQVSRSASGYPIYYESFASEVPLRLPVPAHEDLTIQVSDMGSGERRYADAEVVVPAGRDSVTIKLSEAVEAPAGISVAVTPPEGVPAHFWCVSDDGKGQFVDAYAIREFEFELDLPRAGTWKVYICGGTGFGYPNGLIAGPFTVETRAGHSTALVVPDIAAPPWSEFRTVSPWLTFNDANVSIQPLNAMLPDGAPAPSPRHYNKLYPSNVWISGKRLPVTAQLSDTGKYMRIGVNLPPSLRISTHSTDANAVSLIEVQTGDTRITIKMHGSLIEVHLPAGAATVLLKHRYDRSDAVVVESKNIIIPESGIIDVTFEAASQPVGGLAKFYLAESQDLPGQGHLSWEVAPGLGGRPVAQAVADQQLMLPPGDYVAYCMSQQTFGRVEFSVSAGAETSVALQARHVPFGGRLLISVPEGAGSPRGETGIRWLPAKLRDIATDRSDLWIDARFRVVQEGLQIDGLPIGLEIVLSVDLHGTNGRYEATMAATAAANIAVAQPQWNQVSPRD